jgi:hypothetical protein
MKSLSKALRIPAVCALVIVTGLSAIYAATFEYRFKIHNKSKSKITKVLASPDGKKYGVFDIGSGIKAGETIELVWDKSTDNGNCEWYLKAVFADGDESQPAEFDFCEKNLVVEFSDN